MRATHESNIAFCSGVRCTVVWLSAKNWAKVMPKALHMDSRVTTEGTVLRRLIFAMVEDESFEF